MKVGCHPDEVWTDTYVKNHGSKKLGTAPVVKTSMEWQVFYDYIPVFLKDNFEFFFHQLTPHEQGIMNGKKVTLDGLASYIFDEKGAYHAHSCCEWRVDIIFPSSITETPIYDNADTDSNVNRCNNANFRVVSLMRTVVQELLTEVDSSCVKAVIVSKDIETLYGLLSSVVSCTDFQEHLNITETTLKHVLQEVQLNDIGETILVVDNTETLSAIKSNHLYSCV